MAFKIKDLMINIAPSGEGEDAGPCAEKRSCPTQRSPGGGCSCPTRRSPILLCSCPTQRSPTVWETCPTRRSPGGILRTGTLTTGQYTTGCEPAELLEELSLIKAELHAELAAVDEGIKEVEETLQPKTVEEVQELQTKLQEALDELVKIKAALEKK